MFLQLCSIRSLTKASLGQFHDKEIFLLTLKKTEFIYKNKVKNENLYKALLKWLRKIIGHFS
ncbi:hypothetical protein DMC01_13040 [Campylobacter troglodytis]|nr:hypothetical protein DMC01_13040 [Campylobacter troglodytis]